LVSISPRHGARLIISTTSVPLAHSFPPTRAARCLPSNVHLILLSPKLLLPDHQQPERPLSPCPPFPRPSFSSPLLRPPLPPSHSIAHYAGGLFFYPQTAPAPTQGPSKCQFSRISVIFQIWPMWPYKRPIYTPLITNINVPLVIGAAFT
jgi:hypothetical protein